MSAQREKIVHIHVTKPGADTGTFSVTANDTRKALMPGYKRIPVTLIIHTYEDLPEDRDEQAVRFWIEEHHCKGNYLTQIQEDEERAARLAGLKDPASVCQLCGFAEAYVGHLPFPERKP